MGPDRSRWDDWRIELGVWALAAAVRLLYLAAARPAFTIYYWDAASSLLESGSLSQDGVRTTAIEPLYPLFLAAARLLTGDRPLLVQALQALVASAGAVYLYRLTVALTRRPEAGVAAATIFAVYPLLVRHAIDGTESALLTTLLIAFAYRFAIARGAVGAAAAGAWLGLAILTRAVALPLAVIAPLISGARSRRAGTVMAGAILVVLAPWVARNYTLNGAIIPARGGINLFIANSEYAPGVIADYGPDILLPYAQSRLEEQGLADLPLTPDTERRWDAAFRALALAEIRRHSVDTLRLKVRNLFTFFSPVLVPHRDTSDATEIRLGVDGQSTVIGGITRPLIQRVVYTVSYSIVVALAAVGFYQRRGDLATDAILWCMLLTFAAVHAVYFPSTRYRAPVDFVLLFYAGVGVDTLIDRWRRFRNPSYQRSPATAA